MVIHVKADQNPPNQQRHRQSQHGRQQPPWKECPTEVKERVAPTQTKGGEHQKQTCSSRSPHMNEWYILQQISPRGDSMRRRNPLSLRFHSVLASGCSLAIFAVSCSNRIARIRRSIPDAFVSRASDQSWKATPKATRSLQPGVGMSLPLSRVESMVQVPQGEQSLLHLTDFALRNRPETRAAWERSRIAAAQLGITRGEWYPTLGIDLGLAYERILLPANEQVFMIDQAVLVPSIELNYLLLDFGRREADDDEARAVLWAANLEYDRILQQTIHDVQIAYFKLDAAYALQEAADRNLELALTVVEMVEEQMAVGLATMPMLLLARQDLAQARFDLELTVAGISTAKAALLKGCGLPATVPVEIARIGPDDLPTTLGVSVDRVVDQALMGRPDLAAAIARIRETDAASLSRQGGVPP